MLFLPGHSGYFFFQLFFFLLSSFLFVRPSFILISHFVQIVAIQGSKRIGLFNNHVFQKWIIDSKTINLTEDFREIVISEIERLTAREEVYGWFLFGL